jgi:chromosome segregation protein
MTSVHRLEERIASRRRMVDSAGGKLQETEEAVKNRQHRYDDHKQKLHVLEEEHLAVVREEASALTSLSLANNLLSRVGNEESLAKVSADLVNELKEIVASSETQANQLKQRIASVVDKVALASQRLEADLSRLLDSRVESQVLAFKMKLLSEQLVDLEVQLKLAHEELDPLLAEAEKLGPKLESPRKIFDIMVEIGAMEEQLKPLAHLGEDTERMYTEFAKRYQDLTKKAEEVARNRDELLSELEKRLTRWREVLGDFLDTVNARYNLILSEVKATGELGISSPSDINRAGLEILVGFKGAAPTSLDSFAQSGGERSIAMMSFLLALQQHITSPFRAIDEFDVHMDPRNREIVSRLIVANAKTLGSGQYVAITPGQVHVEDVDVHVIVVQNVEGSSVVSEVK